MISKNHHISFRLSNITCCSSDELNFNKIAYSFQISSDTSFHLHHQNSSSSNSGVSSSGNKSVVDSSSSQKLKSSSESTSAFRFARLYSDSFSLLSRILYFLICASVRFSARTQGAVLNQSFFAHSSLQCHTISTLFLSITSGCKNQNSFKLFAILLICVSSWILLFRWYGINDSISISSICIVSCFWNKYYRMKNKSMNKAIQKIKHTIAVHISRIHLNKSLIKSNKRINNKIQITITHIIFVFWLRNKLDFDFDVLFFCKVFHKLFVFFNHFFNLEVIYFELCDIFAIFDILILDSFDFFDSYILNQISSEYYLLTVSR